MSKRGLVFYFCRVVIFCTLCPIYGAQGLEKEQAGVDQRLNIKSWKTDSGSSVFFVNSQRLPMIDIMVDMMQVVDGTRLVSKGLHH